MVDIRKAKDLQVFIENDEQLYRSLFVPTMEHLKRKMNRGVYDHRKATKSWRSLVDAAVKSYWWDKNKTFNATTRQHVAQSLADEYREELENEREKDD